jgi:hypothetical protein
VLHAGFLNEHFNRPKFIHIVRNGYAVSEGIRRKSVPARWHNPEYSEKYPLNLCARQWVETLETIDELKRAGVDMLEVSYEELACEPDAVLKRIFAFIGATEMKQQVGGEKWLVHGNVEPIRDMNPKSIKSLTAEEREAIRTVAAKWLDRYGYTV